MDLQEATYDDLARACRQTELEDRRLKAENARLAERLEIKIAALRTEIAAKVTAQRYGVSLEDENARLRPTLLRLLAFVDAAGGEERSYEVNGVVLESQDLCGEAANALGIELGSNAYFAAIEPAPSRSET